MLETQALATSVKSNIPDFALVEAILWEHCCGFWLLPEHLARLKTSAAHFDMRTLRFRRLRIPNRIHQEEKNR